MRFLIVDDSRLARLELKEQLVRLHSHERPLEVVAEAASVAEAIAALEEHQPDVILLDIDLPDGNGFDVLEHTSFSTSVNMPQVIFITAFDQFAIRSFEFNALDYVLKPVREDRLKVALGRVRPEQPQSTLTVRDRIFIKDREHCFFVSLQDVLAFEAMGNYTRVHLQNKVPAVYKPISSIELRLDSSFFRASRSWLINTRYIQHIEPALSGGFDVQLSNGLNVPISKRQASEFKRRWAL